MFARTFTNSEWEVWSPMKGRSANLRMIRTNYPNIYPNHRRIAARATRRCRLATRENSRESGPQRRLIARQN